MNAMVYNVAVTIGVLLVGGGIAMINIPAGVIASGVLVLALTIFAARIRG